MPQRITLSSNLDWHFLCVSLASSLPSSILLILSYFSSFLSLQWVSRNTSFSESNLQALISLFTFQLFPPSWNPFYSRSRGGACTLLTGLLSIITYSESAEWHQTATSPLYTGGVKEWATKIKGQCSVPWHMILLQGVFWEWGKTSGILHCQCDISKVFWMLIWQMIDIKFLYLSKDGHIWRREVNLTCVSSFRPSKAKLRLMFWVISPPWSLWPPWPLLLYTTMQVLYGHS